MAGVIDHGDVGIARAVGEVAQCATGLGRREIVTLLDDVEAGILQRCRDHRAVIDRVGKPRHVLISGVAEHQRHALFGESRLAHSQQERGSKEKSA